MLLGKRPRPPIKRTTSMTGITVDLPHGDAPEPSDHHCTPEDGVQMVTDDQEEDVISTSTGLYDNRLLATMVSPRIHSRRSSSDFVDTAHFLTTCGFCKRRLAPGKDIYMYRGDTAFCSLECREQGMKQDERKEMMFNCTKSKKEEGYASSTPPPTRSSKASSTQGEKVAAA